MQFYKRETGDMFPRQQYDRAIFIAEHGSWNRELLIGYRVSVARLDGGGGKVISYQTFMDCLQNKNTTSNKALCKYISHSYLVRGIVLDMCRHSLCHASDNTQQNAHAHVCGGCLDGLCSTHTFCDCML